MDAWTEWGTRDKMCRIPYHTALWEMLVETGWITERVDHYDRTHDPEMAVMRYIGGKA